MALTITIDQDGVLTTMTLTATEETVMRNDLLDISTWIEEAIRGKINNTMKRMVKSGIDELRKAGRVVPASDDAVIVNYAALPGYKNRKQRDLEVEF